MSSIASENRGYWAARSKERITRRSRTKSVSKYSVFERDFSLIEAHRVHKVLEIDPSRDAIRIGAWRWISHSVQALMWNRRNIETHRDSRTEGGLCQLAFFYYRGSNPSRQRLFSQARRVQNREQAA